MDDLALSADKETVAFDIEGTLTTGTAWESVRDYLIEVGEEDQFKDFQKGMTPRYLLYRLRLGNRQQFREDWVAGVLRLLAGRSREEIESLGRRIVQDDLWPKRREDVLKELEAHKTLGRQVVLVSGQFQPFLDAFVEQAGADVGIGTPGVWQDGRFSGELAAPFTVGQRKADLLAQALNGRSLYAAYGDTGPDEAMLAMSERPTAVYPDSDLLRKARGSGWRVIGVQ
jgi:HAD superfamily phosphoserine phosphatase-like hydrolase